MNLGTELKQVYAPTRAIRLRTKGQQHGHIVRLVSPSDLGELIKPFVFLDRIDISASTPPKFGFHPHSGIATLTLLLDGDFSYEDSSGGAGVMRSGSVEWMQAGAGVWHRGGAFPGRVKGYQLWVALPPDHENAPSKSRYLSADAFSKAGPARVILGEYQGVESPIVSPSSINYLDVRLSPGERWYYTPPGDHDVLWAAVHTGEVFVPEIVIQGELAIFESSREGVMFTAESNAEFVVGSAARHPYPLHLGNYSVHTSHEALLFGEEEISRLGMDLQRAGLLKN